MRRHAVITVFVLLVSVLGSSSGEDVGPGTTPQPPTHEEPAPKRGTCSVIGIDTNNVPTRLICRFAAGDLRTFASVQPTTLPPEPEAEPTEGE